MKFGMRPICIYGFLGLSLISLMFLIIQLVGVPVSFWMFMLYACILFLLFGTLFGNLNAIAMEPMGHGRNGFGDHWGIIICTVFDSRFDHWTTL
jgi:DHA1 family bicyclomycin/chloramphenicol resistance-like MFS transporter